MVMAVLFSPVFTMGLLHSSAYVGHTRRRQLISEPFPDPEGFAMVTVVLLLPGFTMGLLYSMAYVVSEFREHFYPPVSMP
eukprot:3622813-Amphidinium_carterae.1